MKVLITGSDGFIAKNLREKLQRDEKIKLYLFSKNDSPDILEAYIKEADFIYHLAGVNRPKEVSEFYEGNSDLTKFIVDTLIKQNKQTPIVLSSSTQANLDNDYGKSKLEAENTIIEYAKKYYIFRLPNVFGKWSKPNYNSVISTWCYNISHDIEIQINDETYTMSLVYIDDVVNEFVKCLNGNMKSG